MSNFVKKIYDSEDGATAIEYGLLAALIAIALITALQNMTGEFIEVFADVEAGMDDTARSSVVADD